ncbi:hypothetical protein [Mycobacterium sp. AT1]|uniref:hypothetical protein n=1 Tax=Mycobacterium sp. AT1 TaxID=1961706 RepID=UPI0018E93FD2|nr:hypothetical protein [Mycobacterium sp. AT1]
MAPTQTADRRRLGPANLLPGEQLSATRTNLIRYRAPIGGCKPTASTADLLHYGKTTTLGEFDVDDVDAFTADATCSELNLNYEVLSFAIELALNVADGPAVS